MDYEMFFLISVLFNGVMLSWNCALLDSRDYWRKKWEKELNSHE